MRSSSSANSFNDLRHLSVRYLSKHAIDDRLIIVIIFVLILMIGIITVLIVVVIAVIQSSDL